jgi:hypothetical protein
VRPFLFATLIGASALSLVGCSNAPSNKVYPTGAAVQRRLSGIHWLYTKFADKNGRTPNNLEEMNAFGRSLPSDEGGSMAFDEEFLQSPRDKKPLVINWGLHRTKNGADGPVLAHESDGSGGKIFVVYLDSGRTADVEPGELSQKK